MLGLKSALRKLVIFSLIVNLYFLDLERGFSFNLASQSFALQRSRNASLLRKKILLFPILALGVNVWIIVNLSRKSPRYEMPQFEPLQIRGGGVVTNNSLEVLHVALEYKGAMIGGIGSVTKSLVPSLNKKFLRKGTREQAVNAGIALPAYSFMNYQESLIEPIDQVTHFYNGHSVKSQILKVKPHDETLNISVYLVSPDERYRDIFKIPTEKELYTYDGAYQPIQRWLYFTTAMAAFISQYEIPEKHKRFDVVHFHGYHTATTVLYLDLYEKINFQTDINRPKTIFHMHSLNFDQGWVQKDLLLKTKLDTQVEWENLTARIIDQVDCTLAVSQAMLTQGLNPDRSASYGLYPNFRNAQTKQCLLAINNGLNIDNFNPEKKSILFGKNGEDLSFSHANIKQGKSAIKKYLSNLGYFTSSDSPLFTFVGRFSDEKGIELLPGAVQTIINLGGQVAIMGEYTKSENSRYFISELKKQAQNRFPGRLLVLDSKEAQKKENLATLIRAGSDFSLVPSHEESFGLVPIEFFGFGTLAIASDAGGLHDTVIPFNRDSDFYNGFLFSDSDPDQLYWSIHQAFKLMDDMPDEFESMREKVLKRASQYDWLAENGSIDKLISLYQGIVHAQP